MDAVSRCGRRRCQLRGATLWEGPLSEDTASLPALVDAPERASALIEVQPCGSDTTSCCVGGNRQSTAGRSGQLQVVGVDLAREMRAEESHGDSIGCERQASQEERSDGSHGEQSVSRKTHKVHEVTTNRPDGASLKRSRGSLANF